MKRLVPHSNKGDRSLSFCFQWLIVKKLLFNKATSWPSTVIWRCLWLDCYSEQLAFQRQTGWLQFSRGAVEASYWAKRVMFQMQPAFEHLTQWGRGCAHCWMYRCGDTTHSCYLAFFPSADPWVSRWVSEASTPSSSRSFFQWSRSTQCWGQAWPLGAFQMTAHILISKCYFLPYDDFQLWITELGGEHGRLRDPWRHKKMDLESDLVSHHPKTRLLTAAVQEDYVHSWQVHTSNLRCPSYASSTLAFLLLKKRQSIVSASGLACHQNLGEAVLKSWHSR